MKKVKNWRIVFTICSFLVVLIFSSSQLVQASTKDNKALYHSYLEAWSQGKQAVLEALDKFFAADCIDHSPAPGQTPGLEGAKQTIAMYFASFPDMQATIEDMIAEGDKVASRWKVSATNKGEFMGMPATGKPVAITGIEIVRIAGGKIVERWENFDALGMMQQLGVVPAPPGQTGETMAQMPAKKEHVSHAEAGSSMSAMSAEKNKDVVRRFFEEIDKGKGPTPAAEALLDPNIMVHIAGNPDMNLEAYKQFGRMFYAGFPDLQHHLEDQVAEGDKVVTHVTVRATHKGDFMGIAPTSKQVTFTGIVIVRIVGGKIAENWVNFDAFGMLQQLGVVPSE